MSDAAVQISPRVRAVIEDADWLAITGESWTVAVRRLGLRGDTLERLLFRAGRSDIIRRLKSRELTEREMNWFDYGHPEKGLTA